MDITPRKGTPPLSSPNFSAVPDRSLSGSRETNENEQPLNQKPMTKNFMSPTISATSKASVLIRKKILAERNGISSSCESLPPHKASNLGPKTSSLNSTSHRSGKLPISSYNYASESDNDQENNSVVDSSYKPYDPLTNDLAPRPKYLRYQPNRRHGTFLDPQKSDDNQGSLQQTQDPSNLPEKYDLEPENDEDVVDSVEDDDEEMEEDGDGEWSLKGLFKILLLLVVFFLSGTNLSSRNPMVISDTGNVIRKNIFEAVFHEIYGSGSVNVDQPEHSQSGFLELSQREVNYELNAVEFVGDIVKLLEVGSVEMEKTTELQEGLSTEIDIDQDSRKVEVTQSVHGDEVEETMSAAAGEVSSSNEVNEEKVEGFDEQLQRDQDLKKNDPEQENLEVLLDDISSTSANEQNAAHSSSEFELAEADNKVEQVEKISQEQAGEVETPGTVSERADEIETEFEISNLDTEIEMDNAKVKEIGPSNAVIIVGVSAASVLLVASLVTIYVSKKPKPSIETTPQAGIHKNPVIASVEAELLERKTETSVKVSSLQEPLNPSENRRNSHLERTPAIGSITQVSSLSGPEKEASKEISYISAPKIELLGEMMIGEVSSSLRSCVGKNSMIEAEGSNTNLSKGVLPPAQPSVVEHSIADSPSYGSFTAEKKILKKKVEKDGEEVKKVVLTTPVRRSSRIRDRVGMSP